MQLLTVIGPAHLRLGDRVVKVGSTITYEPPRAVAAPLGPIEAGSPVVGVRLINPDPNSPIELVLYPSQVAGLEFVIERD